MKVVQGRRLASKLVVALVTLAAALALTTAAWPASSPEPDSIYVGEDGGGCGAPITDGDDHVNGSCDPAEAYDIYGEYSRTIDGAVSRCRRVQQYLTFKAIATRMKIWRYTQEVEWCWNGTKITSIQRDRYPQLFDPGAWYWDFKGHTYSSCMTYQDGFSPCWEKRGQSTAYIATQGKFQACIWKGCWTKLPGLYMNINAKGQITSWGTF